MEKTKFDSFVCDGFAEGCRYCVQGRKLVLFISGKCSRNCWYCSLSNKRKNVDKIWANERECKNTQEMIEECVASQSTGAGITGGDPLLCLPRTLKFIAALKKKFGASFHCHIYLPTDFVTEEKLRKLKLAGVDEVRFHPPLFDLTSIKKIKIANKFWKKQNIGIEIPMFPDKIHETIETIKEAAPFIGFVNLNELEISDTNFDFMTKKYAINDDTYTIKGSKEAGLKVLKECEKLKINLRIHLCTAKTKNFSQYKNRLKLRKIMPFGFKTGEGSVRYFVIDLNNISVKNKARLFKEFKGNIHLDNKKKRIILSEKICSAVFKLGYKVERVEELPTFDGIELERENL